MVIRELSKREAYDLVIGSKILACGGGGSERKAIDNINQTYEKGLKFRIGDLSNFKPEDNICIIGMVGGGITKEDMKLVEGRDIVEKTPMVKAVKELEMFLDVEFSGFVATELGPNNSVIPMMVAANMEKVAVNGDCCGRSKPKISISTTRITGISITPFSIVSKYGDIIVVKETIDDIRGELLARDISRLAGGSVSVARCPMTIKQAKQAVIPQTFSLAIELGKRVRKANENETNTIEEILNTVTGAKVVFNGLIKHFSKKEEGGFTSGDIIIESKEKGNNQLRIWYQNEYLLSWYNDNKFITCPDSICIVDSNTGYGLSPWEDDFSTDRQVTVIAKDAPNIWRSKNGLEIFGPNEFDSNWGSYRRSSEF